MKDLMKLELLKLKRLSLNILLLIVVLMPILIITVYYIYSKDDSSFFDILKDNNVIVSLSIFATNIIFTTFIVAIEYKDNKISYLLITPVARTKILLGKFTIASLIILMTGLIEFGLLFTIGMVVEGFKMAYLSNMIIVWLLSSILYIMLTPLIIYIVLWKKSFAASLLISLVVMIFTTPFMYGEMYVYFPHLIPIVTVSNYLGNSLNDSVPHNQIAFAVLAVLFAIFMFLSVRKFEGEGRKA